MTGFAYTRRDTQRIADYVRRHESRRPKLTRSPRGLRQLRDVRFLICTSEPNVEAIEDDGTWPQTVNAKVLRKTADIDLKAIVGHCNEGGEGGGGGGDGGCPCEESPPCREAGRVRFVWQSGAEYYGFTNGTDVATLNYVRTDLIGGGPCEVWVFESDDGEWVAYLEPNTTGGLYPYCVGCYGAGTLRWNNVPAGLEVPLWSLTGVLGDITQAGGWYCNPLCAQGAHFSHGGFVINPSSMLMYWEGGIGSTANTSDETAVDNPGDDDDPEDDGDLVVKLHRFMNGVPFYGEIFPALNLGGTWYAYGPHHSGIAGSLTDRESPRTVTMDVCNYEVPFIYWGLDDPLAPEGTRHLLAWVAAKQKYVMSAMGDCQ